MIDTLLVLVLIFAIGFSVGGALALYRERHR